MDGISIANTYQHSDLLSNNKKNKAKIVWGKYLDAECNFLTQEWKWSELYLDKQAQRWHQPLP